MGEEIIWENANQKLLGMEVGRNLNFDDYVSSLCRKAGRKLTVSKSMSLKFKQILMSTFVESKFGYCPLIWMFHSREVIRKINHLQERSLRGVYDDCTSWFEDLLKKDHSFNTHHKNMQSLAV